MLDIDLYAGFDKSAPALSAPIEPGILPVCEVLNAIPGIQTLWSCEGHPERQSPPYVTFIGSQETAFQIDQLLSPRWGNGTLKYCWQVVANFRDDGSLQYTIEPNDQRLVRRHCLPIRRWSKASMNQELLRLAELIEQMKQ